ILCNILNYYIYIFIVKCDTINLIMDSIDLFLLNVESLVTERNITKQAFCDELGFSRSSFVNWKKQSSIPNGDTVIKIADFFKVDPKWLLTGEIDLPEKYESHPSAIFERVYHLLLEKTNTPDPDFQNVSVAQLIKMWKTVEKIASCYDLRNWQFNRIMPSYKQILELAEHFGKPFTYIANGISEVPDYLNPCKVPEAEYNDFKRFSRHKNFMYHFDCLSKSSMKIVEDLVNFLFKKEHEE
ncbi:MAG: helix-turn-helix domain-containing protein, partial [Treponema sp.]|nr:helix-turn-helix domain-containing protein [Treponema sp.]